jgi:hypothetical protein
MAVKATVTGEHYAAAVMLSGYLGPPPEGTGTDPTQLVELRVGRPRIVLHHAEVAGRSAPLEQRHRASFTPVRRVGEPPAMRPLARRIVVPERSPSGLTLPSDTSLGVMAMRVPLRIEGRSKSRFSRWGIPGGARLPWMLTLWCFASRGPRRSRGRVAAEAWFDTWDEPGYVARCRG